jgi:6-phosphogluconolactonase
MTRHLYLQAFAALCSSLLLASAGPGAESPPSGEYLVYIGGYTATTSKGIHAYRFQPSTGKLTPIGLVAEAPNPSFLAVSPDRRYLYSVNWRGSETVEGHTVSAYALDTNSGKLTFLNKVSSRGQAPTHLAVDHSGKVVFVVNYDSGSMAVLPIRTDGGLAEASYAEQYSGPGVHTPPGPHAHGVVFSPDNRFAFVADLGLDRICVYRFDAASGAVSPADPPFVSVAAGRGPRHLAMRGDGKFLYANNETASSVTAFAVQGGSLRELQTVTSLPEDFNGNNSTAEIQLDPAGRFLYVSNRGHDSIAVFAVDAARGTLAPVQHVSTQGRTPRNFSLDPTGSYLFAANQNSGTIVLFRVDKASGRLSPTAQVLEVPTPSCVLFVKAGQA